MITTADNPATGRAHHAPIVMPAYAGPAIDAEPGTIQTDEEPWILFVIIVGFLYAVALAYAAYCQWRGGWPSISFSWWTGWRSRATRLKPIREPSRR